MCEVWLSMISNKKMTLGYKRGAPIVSDIFYLCLDYNNRHYTLASIVPSLCPLYTVYYLLFPIIAKTIYLVYRVIGIQSLTPSLTLWYSTLSICRNAIIKVSLSKIIPKPRTELYSISQAILSP